VRSALSKVEGETVDDVKKGSATITVTDAVTEEQISEAIEGAGFKLAADKKGKKEG